MFSRRRNDVPANHNLHALILAAGRGSRLEDETDDRPKCLVELGGRPLIEHQLQCLSEIGIERIFVVAGYLAHSVYEAVGDRAAIVYNRDWARTNSLYSLWFCRHWISGPMLVLNCDVLADPEILTRLLRSRGNAFAYDSSSGSEEEHMKVRIVDGDLRSMSKTLSADQSDGENVGFLYFKQSAGRLLFSAAGRILGKHGHKMWLASAVEHVAHSVPMHGIDISDLPWIEIDYPHDLTAARQEVLPTIQSRLSQAEAKMATMSMRRYDLADAEVSVI